MSKREFDRSWMQQGAQSRLARIPPGEDITRLAAVGFMTDINGLMLDLGSGEGRLEMLLEHGSIVGLDESMHLLKYATKNMKPGVGFTAVAGSMLTIPFRPQSFAAVICINTLENYPTGYVNQLLDEMLMLLKPGGRLVVSYRGCAGARMRYLELLTTLSGSQKCQYRFNPRRWIGRLSCVFRARIVPLLRQPRGWRRWLGTPADARALLIVDKLG